MAGFTGKSRGDYDNLHDIAGIFHGLRFAHSVLQKHLSDCRWTCSYALYSYNFEHRSVLWLRRVMVITPDSDSGNPGSTPGATWEDSFGKKDILFSFIPSNCVSFFPKPCVQLSSNMNK